MVIGYLRQEVAQTRGRSVVAEVLAGAGEVSGIGRRMAHIESELEEATDPDELQNLYDTQPAAAARLAAKLRTFGPAELHPAAVPSEPGNDQRDQLAALGYVSPSRGPAPAAPPAIWPDPKDMIGVYNDIVEQRMRLRGR